MRRRDNMEFETQNTDGSSIKIYLSDEDKRLFVSAICLNFLILSGTKSKTITKDAIDIAWNLINNVKEANWE